MEELGMSVEPNDGENKRIMNVDVVANTITCRMTLKDAKSGIPENETLVCRFDISGIVNNRMLEMRLIGEALKLKFRPELIDHVLAGERYFRKILTESDFVERRGRKPVDTKTAAMAAIKSGKLSAADMEELMTALAEASVTDADVDAEMDDND
jgi:hypothetical protein